MIDLGPEMSDEEYFEATNKLTIALASLGKDYGSIKNELVSFILDACETSCIDDDDVIEVQDSIFDRVFKDQLDAYLDGCAYFVDTFKSYMEVNNIDGILIDSDGVNENNEHSKNCLIETSSLFATILSDRLVDEDALSNDESPFESRVNEVVSQYIDTAFIIGLTDAKTLNYNVNKQLSDKFENLAAVMEAIFPKIF